MADKEPVKEEVKTEEVKEVKEEEVKEVKKIKRAGLKNRNPLQSNVSKPMVGTNAYNGPVAKKMGTIQNPNISDSDKKFTPVNGKTGPAGVPK